MARGRMLDGYVKGLIAQVYMEHPDNSGAKVREEVLKALKAAGYVGEDNSWPSLSAVQKQLKALQESRGELAGSHEEQPWTLLSLALCDMQAEAIPAVLRLWAACVKGGSILTVRQYTDGASLLEAARFFARNEERYELIGAFPENMAEFWWLWRVDVDALRQVTHDDRLQAEVFGRLFQRLSAEASLAFRNATSESYLSSWPSCTAEEWFRASELHSSGHKERATSDSCGRLKQDEGKHLTETEG